MDASQCEVIQTILVTPNAFIMSEVQSKLFFFSCSLAHFISLLVKAV